MTYNWQEWIVTLLIAICIIRLIYGICHFFRCTKNNENPCASCASGCELKRQFEKKQQNCKESKTQQKKNCCG